MTKPKDILTPAQRRLIKQSKKDPEFRFFGYGVSYVTKAKLKELGIIETVLSHTPEQLAEMRSQIQQSCLEMSEAINRGADSKVLTDIAYKINSTANGLRSTKTVLTEYGKTV